MSTHDRIDDAIGELQQAIAVLAQEKHDLLKALEAAIPYIPPHVSALRDIAHAAIAKAKGETQESNPG